MNVHNFEHLRSIESEQCFPPWSGIVDDAQLTDREHAARTLAAKVCHLIGHHDTPHAARGHEAVGGNRGIGQCRRCGWQTYVTIPGVR